MADENPLLLPDAEPSIEAEIPTAQAIAPEPAIAPQQAGSTLGDAYLAGVFGGLRAGMNGGIVTLIVLALNSLWTHHSAWAIPNLMGSTFYGGRVIGRGFGMASVSGIGLYFVMSGLAGVLFGLLIVRLGSPLRTPALSLLFGLVAFYFVHGVFWRRLNPYIPDYSPEPATLVSYLIFGLCLTRAPRYASLILDPVPARTESAADDGTIS